MKPSLLNPDWKYDSAEASRSPGYLQRKFKKLQADDARKKKAEVKSNVALLPVRQR